jgi:hypothetical protein
MFVPRPSSLAVFKAIATHRIASHRSYPAQPAPHSAVPAPRNPRVPPGKSPKLDGAPGPSTVHLNPQQPTPALSRRRSDVTCICTYTLSTEGAPARRTFSFSRDRVCFGLRRLELFPLPPYSAISALRGQSTAGFVSFVCTDLPALPALPARLLAATRDNESRRPICGCRWWAWGCLDEDYLARHGMFLWMRM